MSKELSAMGYTVETYHPRCLADPSVQHIPRKIREGTCEVIWLELPAARQTLAPRKTAAAYKDIASWMKCAKVSNTVAYLAGLRGRHWLENSSV